MIRHALNLMEERSRATVGHPEKEVLSPGSEPSPASAVSPGAAVGFEDPLSVSAHGGGGQSSPGMSHRHSLREPFVPPKLSEASHAVTDESALSAIFAAVPARYRDSDLRLVYTTVRHGASVRTFMDRCEHSKGPLLLLVRDKGGAVFGAFTTEPKWKVKKKYYGTGEVFCFTIVPKIAVYPWSHKNKFFQTASPESIAVGGGGSFALFLGDMFERGTSGQCETFDSPMLSSTELFEVIVFEAWELVHRHL